MPLLTHSSLPDPTPFCFCLSPPALHFFLSLPPPPSFPLKQSNCLQHSSESPTLSDADQAPASQSLFSTTTVNTSCGSRSRRNLLLTLVCVGASAPLCGCVCKSICVWTFVTTVLRSGCSVSVLGNHIYAWRCVHVSRTRLATDINLLPPIHLSLRHL